LPADPAQLRVNHVLREALAALGGAAPAPHAGGPPPPLSLPAPPPEDPADALFRLACQRVDEWARTDFLVYVDCSGSMGGSKIRKASSTVGALFRNKMGPRDRIELSSFTEGAPVLLVPLARQADIPAEAFRAARARLTAAGGTWLYSCIAAAFARAEEVAAADAAAALRSGGGGGGGGGGDGGAPLPPPANKRIIVLTDGCDCGSAERGALTFEQAAAAVAGRGGASRARVFFAAVGDASEHQKLAERFSETV